MNDSLQGLLTLNAGSSSIKFSLYAKDSLEQLLVGELDAIGGQTVLKAKHADGQAMRHDWPLGEAPVDHAAALEFLIEWIRGNLQGIEVCAVGHRVVHGGQSYDQPVIVTPEVLAKLIELEPLAPLHQPHNVAGIQAALAIFPEVPQIACFDTAFHCNQPFVKDCFALPRSYYEEGVRRYGFHGLSYEYIARTLKKEFPLHASGRVIIAHLGNGASMCGMVNGHSVTSTMGFSALDGLPMGTRCGQLDPGVLLYLLQAKGMGADEISDLLYKQSGLKGISGLSNDMRTLEASKDPAARDAIDYFIYRIKREIGALTAALEGLDAIVFTGGIGENSVMVRRRVLRDLAWLGVELDERANEQGETIISTPRSRVLCLRMPTNEEQMIVRHVEAMI